jgi:predicted DNA-binding transcriptional regulator AlpA
MQNLVAANDNFPAVIDPLLPLRAVRAATGQGSSTIYRKMAIGAFPRPYKSGRVASAGARPRLSRGLTEYREPRDIPGLERLIKENQSRGRRRPETGLDRGCLAGLQSGP